MKMPEILRVGDAVIWKGSWGQDSPLEAKVASIEETVGKHQKNGESVSQTKWSRIKADRAVVDLDNGHWAYGNQLQPIE